VSSRPEFVRAVVLAGVMLAASLTAMFMTPTRYLADRAPREKLAQMVPKQFGAWSVDNSIVPIPPSPDLQQVLDATYDEVVALTYRNTAGQRVMLSLAYGRNQHKGMNTHRPEVCYPAQGFRVTQSAVQGRLPVAAPGGKFELPLTRLVAAMNQRNEPISYWLLVGDTVTPFGYAQRWVTLQHGLRGEIPDGVLVRVSSIDSKNSEAFALQDAFIRDLLSALPEASLARLVGKLRRLP
jgi:EpsI family protein